MLKIDNLEVEADNKIILNDFNLSIKAGTIHAIMGPNGMGKSTICNVLMAHPNFKINKGTIKYNNQDITNASTQEKAKLGFFLLAQNPVAIEGVSNAELLRAVLSSRSKQALDILKFHKELKDITKHLNIPSEFIHRDINYGMSGGERKKNELMHLWMLKPKVIILDEIDSGLDVDSFKSVLKSVNEYYQTYKPTIIIVTHNIKVFKYLKPDKISILNDGKIITTGDSHLANIIERDGFKAFLVSKKENNE